MPDTSHTPVKGPDSERIREVIRRVLRKTRFRDPEDMADPILAALRAKGHLPAPDAIVVSREDVRIVVHGGAEDQAQLDQVIARLRAALSHSHPEETP